MRLFFEMLLIRVLLFELFCLGFLIRVLFLLIVCLLLLFFNVELLLIDVFDELVDNKFVCDEEIYFVLFGLSIGDDDIEEDEFMFLLCVLLVVVKRILIEFDLLLF